MVIGLTRYYITIINCKKVFKILSHTLEYFHQKNDMLTEVILTKNLYHGIHKK